MPSAASDRPLPSASPAFDLVVVAASLGGVRSLAVLFSALPAEFPAPIGVVQHLLAGRTSALDRVLGYDTRLPVHWAEDGARPGAGTITLAPPDRHLRLAAGGICRLDAGPKISFVRPAADALFESAA